MKLHPDDALHYKEIILNMIRQRPMKYREIRKKIHYSVDDKNLVNFIIAIKKQGLIIHNKVGGRNDWFYTASDMIGTYYEVRHESWSRKEREKKVIKESKPGVKVVSSNDYHTRGNKHKNHAWIGSTFGTMDYGS